MKGVSHLLGVVIILILVISVGAVIFTFSYMLFRDRSRFADSSVDANLIIRDEYAVLNVKVRNLGTYEINKIMIYSDVLTVNGSKLNHEYNVMLHNGESFQGRIFVDINSVKNPSKIVIKVYYVDGEAEEKTIYIYPSAYS